MFFIGSVIIIYNYYKLIFIITYDLVLFLFIINETAQAAHLFKCRREPESMLKYFMKSRPGQFLLLGVLFIIIGFVAGPFSDIVSRIAFYIAIFFLGFFAARHAVVDTMKKRSPNVDLLMILAALGAVIINYESEGAILLLIFAGAEVLEDYASAKSTNAISALMSQVPSTAIVLKDNGETEEIETEELKVGDIVVVSKGEQIPIDGHTDRLAMVNESALTGESVPVNKEKGAEVFAGTINEGHVIYIEVKIGRAHV